MSECVCVCVCVSLCVGNAKVNDVCMYACVHHAYMYICVRVYVLCVYMCMYICMHACILRMFCMPRELQSVSPFLKALCGFHVPLLICTCVCFDNVPSVGNKS